MVASIDATWEEFMRGCIAMPDNCALAKNRTYDELEAAMTELFDTVRNNPPVFNGTVVFAYDLFKAHIFSTLYSPANWPGLAQALEDVLEGNLETFVNRVLAFSIPSQDQAILGIRCGDKKLRTNKLSDLEPVFEQYHKTSKWFWDWAWGYYVMPCAQWGFEAKERYEGDFQVKTKNPVLFVGNSFDPVTPLASAKNMSSGFEGSVLLTHNGHGVSGLFFSFSFIFSAPILYPADWELTISCSTCLSRSLQTAQTLSFKTISLRENYLRPEPCANPTSRCSTPPPQCSSDRNIILVMIY